MPALTERERRALLTVAFVVALSALVQWVLPHQTKIKQFDYTLEDSLFKALSGDTATLKIQEKKKISLKETREKRRARPRSRISRKKSLAPKSINPNTASAKELELLPYIGPKTAKAIIQYRQEHGPFKTIEALDNVKRIGPKTIERIRPYLFLPDSGQKRVKSQKNNNNP